MAATGTVWRRRQTRAMASGWPGKSAAPSTTTSITTSRGRPFRWCPSPMVRRSAFHLVHNGSARPLSQIDHYFGMGRQKSAEVVRKELDNRAQVGPQPYEPTDAACIFLQFDADAYDVLQHPSGTSQNRFPGGGQRHSVCAPIKQLGFDRVLQVGEPLAHGRWSDRLPLRCSRESSFLANGDEQLQCKNVEIAQ